MDGLHLLTLSNSFRVNSVDLFTMEKWLNLLIALVDYYQRGIQTSWVPLWGKLTVAFVSMHATQCHLKLEVATKSIF